MKIDVNDGNFDELVKKQSENVPVVVDFLAPWCMPCQFLGPVLENIGKKYQGKAVVAKMNVDENPQVSSQFGIRSIPSVKLFKNGQVVDEFVGALPEASIEQWLNQHIN